MRTKTDKTTNWETYWTAFRNGDMEAFHHIYVIFFDSLYNYGSKLTRDNAILEDSIQELFLQLYTKRDNLTNPDNLEYYLLKSLKYIIWQRNRKRNKFVFSGLTENEFDDSNFIFEQEQNSEGNEDKLNYFLNSLDSKQRELLFLKFDRNLSYKEIGNMLGIQPDSAKKQVYRIVSRLKNKFKDYIVTLFLYFHSKN